MAGSGISAGVYGKHPAFGDFLAAGFSDGALAALESWLNAVLPEMRALCAEAWEAVFDAAPAVRFWIGADLAQGAALAGVMVASRDKVGRRFPLIAGVEGADLAPPVLNADQALYDALNRQLTALDPAPDAGAAGLAAALVVGDLQPAPVLEPSFWAQRPGPGAEPLWADVAAADHLRAAGARSYWWLSGSGQSVLYACAGLPPAAVMCWLITDATRGRASDGVGAKLETEAE